MTESDTIPPRRTLPAIQQNRGQATPVDISEGDTNDSGLRTAWTRQFQGADTKTLLEEDAKYFLHQALSTPCLDVLTGCDGSHLENLRGERFLDFHGNSLHQVGYANPYVVSAISIQMKRQAFCPRRFTNIPAIELAKTLSKLAPGDLNRVLFAPGGTTAVGIAMKLARVATGRFKTLSMWDSFHGASLDAVSIGGERHFRQGIGPLLPGTEHVPPAAPYRCIWNNDGRCETCGLKCAEYVAYVLEKERDIGAVIAEPIRCTAVHCPPPGYWEKIRRACNRFGSLLIFDETAVCLGRTGKFFAFEHFRAIPDIVVIGKGLGGGIFPLAAVIAREHLNSAQHHSLGHYTHEKNPVACAAGLSTIHYIQREKLLEKAEIMGKEFLRRLDSLKGRHPIIGDVRGKGMIFAVELVADPPTKAPACREAEQIMYRCLSKGLNFKVTQGNILTLTPPLTISPGEMNLAIDILDESISEIEAGPFRGIQERKVSHE
jgi:4-aminobutyrate aminotransferase